MYLKIKDDLLQLPKRKIANLINPDDYPMIININRVYGNHFLNNYSLAVNRGAFAKNGDKSVPLISTMVVYGRKNGETECLRKGETIYSREQLEMYSVLENANCLIPKGCYEVVLSDSPKFGVKMPYLLDVPSRSGIMFHAGNKATDSKGCILVGAYDYSYVDGIACSASAFEKFKRDIAFVSSPVLLIIDEHIEFSLPF